MACDKNTGFKLWRCPYEIMRLVDEDEKIKEFMNDLFGNVSIEIPVDYIFSQLPGLSNKEGRGFG